MTLLYIFRVNMYPMIQKKDRLNNHVGLCKTASGRDFQAYTVVILDPIKLQGQI